jgi:membrane protein YqaA with SNARE-associated domain
MQDIHRRDDLPPAPAVARPSLLHRLYGRMLALAEGPHALWVMAVVSFTEASFFPLPPDPLLVPMMLAKPRRAWFYAGVCTVASVLGGLLGYAIGALLYDTIGKPILEAYKLTAAFAHFQSTFVEWGAWIIVAKGLTPIPFKLVTIACGTVHLDLATFVISCIVTRGARFFLIAALLRRYGDRARVMIDKHLHAVTWGVFALLVLGIGAVFALH